MSSRARLLVEGCAWLTCSLLALTLILHEAACTKTQAIADARAAEQVVVSAEPGVCAALEDAGTGGEWVVLACDAVDAYGAFVGKRQVRVPATQWRAAQVADAGPESGP